MRNSAAYLVSGPVGYEDFLTKTWADCGLKNFPGMCMVDIGVIQHLHPAMFVVPQLAYQQGKEESLTANRAFSEMIVGTLNTTFDERDDRPASAVTTASPGVRSEVAGGSPHRSEVAGALLLLAYWLSIPCVCVLLALLDGKVWCKCAPFV